MKRILLILLIALSFLFLALMFRVHDEDEMSPHFFGSGISALLSAIFLRSVVSSKPARIVGSVILMLWAIIALYLGYIFMPGW
jgi:putative exporter of polyketide antibiotics